MFPNYGSVQEEIKSKAWYLCGRGEFYTGFLGGKPEGK
jgi:hypothetical protein